MDRFSDFRTNKKKFRENAISRNYLTIYHAIRSINVNFRLGLGAFDQGMCHFVLYLTFVPSFAFELLTILYIRNVRFNINVKNLMYENHSNEITHFRMF